MSTERQQLFSPTSQGTTGRTHLIAAVVAILLFLTACAFAEEPGWVSADDFAHAPEESTALESPPADAAPASPIGTSTPGPSLGPSLGPTLETPVTQLPEANANIVKPSPLEVAPSVLPSPEKTADIIKTPADASEPIDALKPVETPTPLEAPSKDGRPLLVDTDFARFAPSLTSEFDALLSYAPTSQWTADADSLLRTLHQSLVDRSFTARNEIDRLERHAAAAGVLVAQATDYDKACALQRSRMAIVRRLALWRYLAACVDRPGAPVAEEPLDLASAPTAEAFQAAIDAALGQLDDSDYGRHWRGFLMLDALDVVADIHAESPERLQNDPLVRLTMAMAIERLRTQGVSSEQAAFLREGPNGELHALLSELYRPTATPRSLWESSELYEATAAPSAGNRMLADIAELRIEGDPNVERLEQEIGAHYRNANLRFTIHEQLLNRLVPEREREYSAVHDRIAGQPVEGHRWTDTEVVFRMIPDPVRLLLALDVNGVVSASTKSSSMAATFFNNSKSAYKGTKRIEIDTRGLHMAPAELSVDNNTHLRSVRTSLDMIPLLGDLAGEVARSEHMRARPKIAAEVRQKVYNEAKNQIDGEADQRLEILNHRLRERVLVPISRLGLGPTPIQNTTTEDALIGRWRVAACGQLGSHTPRPCEPPGSLAACQAHESMINNMIQRLALDGRTFTVAELRENMAARLDRPEWLTASSEEDEEDLEITFADHDAILVHLDDGLIQITLNIASLRYQNRHWADFRVVASYAPASDGLAARLDREGVVEVLNVRGIRSRLPLLGIFNSIFLEDKPIPISPPAMISDPRLAGLRVTQFHVDDGWLGFAIGPAPTAAVAARPDR